MSAQFFSTRSRADFAFSSFVCFRPGGIGKTTLIKEFAALAEQKNLPAFYLDVCNVEPSPQSLLDALRLAMGLDSSVSPVETLATQSTRHIHLIDTLEILAPLDNWLCETFLPQLPEDTLLVLASRDAPSLRGALIWERCSTPSRCVT